jgi:hypothetical protein
MMPLCWFEQHLIELLTMGGTVATAFIIWQQAHLLREQNQVNALILLQQEWESPRLHSLRSNWAWAPTKETEALEPILEFLEEFAGFRKRKVLNDQLIWDTTIGWHAARYYFYNMENGNIDKFRKDWQDNQIFQNLEKELWRSYVRNELSERPDKNEEHIKRELRDTMERFLEREKSLR